MHKLPERLDQTKFLTNHQNKYHRIVTKFLAKRKTDQRINRSEKLQDEFDKLDLEYYNPRPRSTIDPATSNDKKNLEIRTNKRLLTHRHIYSNNSSNPMKRSRPSTGSPKDSPVVRLIDTMY
ncbi:unnamed protein product [Rhizophagus irregularis]|uniref:Uncharacterized protein n=1 Tax=Rhizophagus irregularis TaxID=588596 RepID=A0A915YVM2_9GLOM|nr:unnamed protein product [Rhizophagus irregularis]